MNGLKEILYSVIPLSRYYTKVNVTGNIIIDNNMIRVDNIQLDPGATDSSYINSTFINKHSIFLNKYKYKTNKNSSNLAVKMLLEYIQKE